MKTEAIIGLGWLLPFLLGLSETMLKIPILDNTTYKLYSAVKKGEMRIIDEQVDGYSVLQHLERGEFDKIFFKQWEKKIYEVYLWLQENSHKYGVIFRYPGSKTDITGVSEEMWHYRYVGTEAAVEMYEQDLCLEEYLEQRKRH